MKKLKNIFAYDFYLHLVKIMFYKLHEFHFGDIKSQIHSNRVIQTGSFKLFVTLTKSKKTMKLKRK